MVRKEASEAERLLEKKPIALEKLGRAGQFIKVAKKFGEMVAEVGTVMHSSVSHKFLPPARLTMHCSCKIDSPGGKSGCHSLRHSFQGRLLRSFQCPSPMSSWQKLEEQEEIHEDAVELLEEMQLFLPFTEVVDLENISSKSARDAVKVFLELFRGTCEFIVQFSGSGIIGNLKSVFFRG